MKKLMVLLVISLLFITGCGSDRQDYSNYEHPIVEMEFENFGTVKIELYPDVAPNTVANFVNLVENGFFEGNIINRVQKGFVIQGGGGKDISYAIKGEFNNNGFQNDLSHEKGVISMARTPDPDSAGGQFFIVLDDVAKLSLDGAYAGFGKVIEGFDIIEKIENKEYKFNPEQKDMGFLNQDEYIKIKKVSVDTKGNKYKVKKIAKASN